MAMNMHIEFDVFAANLLDQIEAVQALAQALAPTRDVAVTKPDSANVPVLDVDEADRDAWRALVRRAEASSGTSYSMSR